MAAKIENNAARISQLPSWLNINGFDEEYWVRLDESSGDWVWGYVEIAEKSAVWPVGNESVFPKRGLLGIGMCRIWHRVRQSSRRIGLVEARLEG